MTIGDSVPMKDRAYYLELPYTRRIAIEGLGESAYFLASFEELPGVHGEGANHVEAVHNLHCWDPASDLPIRTSPTVARRPNP